MANDLLDLSPRAADMLDLQPGASIIWRGARLNSTLAGELGAPAVLAYDREGVTCRMRVPTA